MAKIIKRKSNHIIESKRLTLPFKVQDKCPKCGASTLRDLQTNGLQRIGVNENCLIDMDCPTCEHEWHVKVYFELKATLVKDNDQ